MRSRSIKLACLFVCIAIAVPLFALQRGSDPVTGTWSGDWGPNAQDRNPVNVDLKLDGKNITGTVHSLPPYNRPDVMLTKGTYDAGAGTVHLEADASGRRGSVHYVIDGKLSGGTMSGSWNHDASKGDFTLKKK